MEKIYFFEMEDWEKEHIDTSLSEMQPQFLAEKLCKENASKFADATIISTFNYSEQSRDVLSLLPQLKMIATRSTGYDAIDMDYCKEKGITVCNVPAYGAHTVAEHTFALLLALSRNIVASVERTRRGNFAVSGLEGFDLNGKTLGVVGTGTIGKRVAQIGRCFGMNVLAFAHHPDEDLQKDSGVKYVTFAELLSGSDIITLHVPGGKDNEHMINMDNIKTFKKGSVLINTARGSLVETGAIVFGLEQGILKGVGLDVLEEEPMLKEEHQMLSSEFMKTSNIQTVLMNHLLLNRDDVIITPHNAFHSHEALLQIVDTTVGNIKRFLSGQPMNVVT